MKSRKIVMNTTNRGEFNRAYKEYLTHLRNGIHCSRCKYHSSENCDDKWYGGFLIETNNDNKIRYPNWKLVSKNNKQWMNKPVKIIENNTKYNNSVYINIKF